MPTPKGRHGAITYLKARASNAAPHCTHTSGTKHLADEDNRRIVVTDFSQIAKEVLLDVVKIQGTFIHDVGIVSLQLLVTDQTTNFFDRN